jgi:hypothetical protein
VARDKQITTSRVEFPKIFNRIMKDLEVPEHPLSDFSMLSRPRVSVTATRVLRHADDFRPRDFIRQSIKVFSGQDYTNRELLIVTRRAGYDRRFCCRQVIHGFGTSIYLVSERSVPSGMPASNRHVAT